MELMVVLVLLLTGAVVGLSVALKAQLKKVEILEQAVEAFFHRTSYTIKLMRVIDTNQIFENEDEVGDTFRQLLAAVNELSDFIEDVRGDEEED